MSISSLKNKISLPTAIGLGTAVVGAAGNVLGQLLGTGLKGADQDHSKDVSQIRTFGVMRDNLFGTTISVPEFLKPSEGTNGPKIEVKGRDDIFTMLDLYAESVNLPGVNLTTGAIRRYGFGPNVPFVRDVGFNDVAVTFIGDGTGAILKYFTDWTSGIVRFKDRITPGDLPNDMSPFFFRYKKDYVARAFFITMYNEKRDEVSVYSFEDAFPTSISDINLSWGNTNQLARFTVNFSYTRFAHETAVYDLFKNLRDAPNAGDSSLLSMIFQAGTAGIMLSSLRRPQSIGDIRNVTSTAAQIFGNPFKRGG